MMISIIMIPIVMTTGKRDNCSDKTNISYNYKCII